MNITNLGQSLVDLITYPDGQPHVRLPGTISRYETCNVTWSIRNPQDMMQLLLLSEAIDGTHALKEHLRIPYLMGARSDRRAVDGESFTLKVVAQLINSCKFDEVELCDVHSDVATALIEHSINLKPKNMIRGYKREDATLIIPDAGGYKRVPEILEACPSIVRVVGCQKHRDPVTGRIALKVLEPQKCRGNVVIIDDICDGGATFIAIADQIAAKHATLIVSHGIFSKGLAPLEAHFDEIWTTDSFKPMSLKSLVDWKLCDGKLTVYPQSWAFL